MDYLRKLTVISRVFCKNAHQTLCMCVCAQSLQLCPNLCDPLDCSPPGCSVHGDSPGRNTGVGSHALLQGIFQTLGSNPHLMSPASAGGFFATSASWEVPQTLWGTFKRKGIKSIPVLDSWGGCHKVPERGA